MEESIDELLKNSKADVITDYVLDLMKDRRYIFDIDKQL